MFAAEGFGQQQAPAFGTTNTSYQIINDTEFNPLYSSDSFFRGFSLNAIAGSGIFDAPIHLPDGALLTYAELDFCDSNTSGNHLGIAIWDLPAIGTSPPVDLQDLGSVSNVSQPCASVSADMSGLNYTVDNKNHRLFVGLLFNAFDSTNQITAVVIGYKLQVSPAPGSPSFNDVPISHPFFQYIEALKASGITGGCQASPPLYCPDNPVTRGQMAVFLAKALGLSFN